MSGTDVLSEAKRTVDKKCVPGTFSLLGATFYLTAQTRNARSMFTAEVACQKYLAEYRRLMAFAARRAGTQARMNS